MAFKDHDDVSVALSFDIELPIMKKGPAYHMDYVILLDLPVQMPEDFPLVWSLTDGNVWHAIKMIQNYL